MEESDSSCIVVLEEVMEHDRVLINESGLFFSQSYSLDYRKPGKLESTSRRLGCFVGVTGNLIMKSSGIIHRAPFQERTLFADILLNEQEIKIMKCR
ncbi:hypothetical protein V7127_00135 [Bacillus sp. JJ1773]|uniref:hypothetical protein n=1 Tax=Bacillus sp. JJ1773 TaxID=3122965 RepID=UPI002FFDF46F